MLRGWDFHEAPKAISLHFDVSFNVAMSGGWLFMSEK